MDRPDAGRRIRIWLLSVTATLIGIGVVMIYSASAIYAWDRYQDSMFFLKRHLIFLMIGSVGFFGAMVVDLERLRKLAPLLLVGIWVTLLFVGFFGPTIGGARRWISLGPMNVQPSEFAKLVLILFLAGTASKKTGGFKNFKKDLLPLIVSVGVTTGLVLLGKDLGTTVVLMAVFLMILFVAGIPLKYFAWMAGACIPVVVGAILVEPYRLERLKSFMDPFADIRGKSFQLYQSLLAIGSGGFLGKGLGQSQQKLFYLPEAHTDFIYSIIGEEAGFIGASGVIILFILFGLLGLMIVRRASSPYRQLLATGLVSLVLIEAVINIGVSIGALPTKGLALPFISYGGSSLVVNMILVGLLLNISREKKELPEGWRKSVPA